MEDRVHLGVKSSKQEPRGRKLMYLVFTAIDYSSCLTPPSLNIPTPLPDEKGNERWACQGTATFQQRN